MKAEKMIKKLKEEGAIERVADFLKDVVKLPGWIPGWAFTYVLPFLLEKVLELLARSMPNRIIGEAFRYVSDEVSENGILADEQVDAYAEFLNSEVDIPWFPEWLEKRMFRALIYLISFAADSGMDAITASDVEDVRDRIVDRMDRDAA